MTTTHLVRLGELCEVSRATIAPDEPDYVTLLSVGVEQVESVTGAINLNPGSRTGDGRSVNFRFDERHVLYGKLRPYLNKVALPDFSGRCSTELIPLLPAPDVDRAFLAALLRRPETVQAVMAANTGSRMPRTDMNVLLSLKVPRVTHDEQRRIVDLLDRAASIRRLRRQSQETARQVIPALFNKMFGDPATNPMRWPVHQLGDILAAGPQNGLYRPATDYGRGTRILRIDSFYDGHVTDLETLRRLELDSDTVAKYRLRPCDIVINRVNSRPYLGKSAIIPQMVEPVVFESNMMRIALDRTFALPEYVITFLQLKHARTALIANAKDAINQSSINQRDVTGLRILVPPLLSQEQFARLMHAVNRTMTRQAIAAEYDAFITASLSARLLG